MKYVDAVNPGFVDLKEYYGYEETKDEDAKFK
jgi:hypothetical protein